ncbi:MAG: FHA domain-containing protein [Oligoflexales bacterium]|nr:FHA domain-containing protein [Oligoflexales bacterium]
MNSSNGTIVNGAKVIKQKLEDGDRILIGKTEILFKLEDEKQVRHISTISSAMKEFNAGHDKTSIVDTLLENEIKNNQKWEVLLSVTYSDGSQEDYRLQQNTIFIGRATSFGKFEDDSDISRRHLLIKLNDNGEVFIEDEGSTNGSYLNGKRIRGIHLVSPSDEIKLGSCRLRIQSFSR